MRTTAVVTATLLAATLAPPAAAQSTPVAATVYTAWLQEVIDCDSAAAAETLSRLSYDTHTPKVDRWLATARLLELRRVGVGATLPSAILDDVPVELRDYFKDRTSEREDLQGLQQLVRQEDGKLLDSLRSSPRRGSFRPLVATTVRWAAEQNPELQKTRRLLWQQWLSARRAGNDRAALEASQKLRQLPSGQPGLLQREHALQILLRELAARTSEADRLRRDYFPDWQKPRLTADTSTLLANALRRLTDLADDSRPEEQEALQQLGQKMRKLGATDESAALHLLDRLPFYAELLLR